MAAERTLGPELRAHRARRRQSTAQAAAEVGVSRPLFTAWENEEVQHLTLLHVHHLLAWFEGRETLATLYELWRASLEHQHPAINAETLNQENS